VRLVISAIEPLGSEYGGVLEKGLRGRWSDRYPNQGKQSGAFSSGSYDGNPYILMNYQPDVLDHVFTLAHEAGHSMHTHFSARHQPFQNYQYTIFVAEVASTFNEALLMDYMLKQIEDEPTRLSLLGSYLESIKATVFRQTQFAEFELRMHEMGLASVPVTGDALAGLYLDITRRYYGHDQRIVVVDDDVANEWSYIPHFYTEFYVFQYATSYAVSQAIMSRFMAGDKSIVAKYIEMLSAGGSDYPIELLKNCGVDMTKPEAVEATVKMFAEQVDEMERLAGGLGK
ncbi:MAG: oligoendopeptidase F, partial [candidate division Zixibacteria bacterium]|nr:oligoendopeptidase F [candidate division Zixibacteria bacterium]